MRVFTLLSTILLSISFAFTTLAQDGTGSVLTVDPTIGSVRIQEVVDVGGAAPDDLHARASHWFNTYFTNPNSVIKTNDEEQGIVGGQHTINIYNKQKDNILKGKVKYQVKIEAKDGRYRYTVEDIFFVRQPKLYIHEWMEDTDENRKFNQQYVTQVEDHMQELIGNLKETMAQPVPGAKSDDW